MTLVSSVQQHESAGRFGSAFLTFDQVTQHRNVVQRDGHVLRLPPVKEGTAPFSAGDGQGQESAVLCPRGYGGRSRSSRQRQLGQQAEISHIGRRSDSEAPRGEMVSRSVPRPSFTPTQMHARTEKRDTGNETPQGTKG